MSFSVHKFFDISSSNYKKLLEQAQKDGDVTINVGNKSENNYYTLKPFREFKAHSLILSAQCSWFNTILSTKKENDEENIVIDMPNISPPIFEIILKFLYCGEMSLTSLWGKDVFDLLTAIYDLKIHDLLEFLQDFLSKYHNRWLQKNFFLTYKITLEHQELKLLHQHVDKIIQNQPDILFLAEDFTKIDKDLLNDIIKRDKLAISEIDIWKKLIMWGKENLQNSKPLISWNEKDFKDLKLALDQFLPSIRFINITPIDYYYEVRPYEKILSEEIKEEMIRYHMTSYVSNPKYKLIPRIGNIDSTLITSIEAAIIATEISNSIFVSHRFSENPHEFRLLLRGSQDGFNSKTFRLKCVDKGPTVVIMRVSGSRKIIGGYNPLKWKNVNAGQVSLKNRRLIPQSSFNHTTDSSFIFSFHDAKNGTVISRVEDVNKAIGNLSNELSGPEFGDGDLVMAGNNFKIDRSCYCKKTSYKKPIMESMESTESIEKFSVNEYEVFEIISRFSGFGQTPPTPIPKTVQTTSAGPFMLAQTTSSGPFKSVQTTSSFGFGSS